jgi:hypothetical protein
LVSPFLFLKVLNFYRYYCGYLSLNWLEIEDWNLSIMLGSPGPLATNQRKYHSKIPVTQVSDASASKQSRRKQT